MALTEMDASDCNSDSSVDGNTKQDRKDKPLTKVVVRRLPPSMNKDIFLNQVSPLPDYDYMYFVKADMSLGEAAFSRAYVNFKNAVDIFIFKEKFDNYVFLDNKGNEYTAVVEFAPFSRIPKKRNKKPDPKSGTIETDTTYLEFVESLKTVPNLNEEKPEYCFQPPLDNKKEITNTPLLEFVKQRRIDRQKMKDERREERRRREFERKRIKEEERKSREKFFSSRKPHNIKLNFEVSEEKSDLNIKKDRKPDDYRNKMLKTNYREYPDKRSFIPNKNTHSAVDRKAPLKCKPRNSGFMEVDSRKKEYKNSKRDDSRKEDKEEKTTEKKVKKYSERREERKNEFKRIETNSEPRTSVAKEEKTQNTQEVNKGDKNKTVNEHKKEYEGSKKYDPEKSPAINEAPKRRDNDPRTQRRIRNKDRPAMQIYQPGMGLGRVKKPTSEEKDIKE